MSDHDSSPERSTDPAEPGTYAPEPEGEPVPGTYAPEPDPAPAPGTYAPEP